MAGKLFVISAPSGTGKTTLVNALLRDWSSPHHLKRVITYTSRPPRRDEVEGRDYHFVSREDFEKKEEESFFLESGMFCGNYYGSPRYVVDPSSRKDCSYLLVMDRVGGLKIKDIPGVVLLWITPPSLQELRLRLEKRGKDSIESIEQRIKKAEEELECEEREKGYRYHIVNGYFAQAEKELKSLLEAIIEGGKGALK